MVCSRISRLFFLALSGLTMCLTFQPACIPLAGGISPLFLDIFDIIDAISARRDPSQSANNGTPVRRFLLPPYVSGYRASHPPGNV